MPETASNGAARRAPSGGRADGVAPSPGSASGADPGPSRAGSFRGSSTRAEVLLESARAASAGLDRGPLLRAIAGTLRRVIPMDRASVGLLDAEDDVVSVITLVSAGGGAAATDVAADAPTEAMRLPAGESTFGLVASTRRTWHRRDLGSVELHPGEELPFELGIRSYICAPLVVGDRCIGALAVGSERADRYGPGEVELLEEVAAHMALGLDNMLAYEEVERLRERLELENRYLREEVRHVGVFGEMVGDSRPMVEVFRKVEQVAPTDASVLVVGESGTGKELVAREIHARSARSDGPLITVNCAALPRELYESEFFGHVKGAFSGAVKDRQGRFAAADGGTLFLDEVGELPLEVQGKLLRVIQDGTYERVGETRTRAVDVRILAASNRDLEAEVRAGRFRGDLFYRLNVFPIRVPPLRERPEDIPLLAHRFLREFAERSSTGTAVPNLSEADLQRLRHYPWPGNARELRNVLERAVITAREGRLSIVLPEGAEPPPANSPSGNPGAADGTDDQDPEVVSEEEMQRRVRANIEAALRRTGGKIYGSGGAAELLGIPGTTLASRVKRLGIRV